MRHWTALAIATDDAVRSAVSIPAQSRLKINTVYKMATKNYVVYIIINRRTENKTTYCKSRKNCYL
jgi:hypothetical protein